MSATENSEFVVPESVENEKEESKEIKATKRPAEVSSFSLLFASTLLFSSLGNFPTLRLFKDQRTKNQNRIKTRKELQTPSFSSEIYRQHFFPSHEISSSFAYKTFSRFDNIYTYIGI